jgi:hypothetical protein
MKLLNGAPNEHRILDLYSPLDGLRLELWIHLNRLLCDHGMFVGGERYPDRSFNNRCGGQPKGMVVTACKPHIVCQSELMENGKCLLM